jgi:hypothetical protein
MSTETDPLLPRSDLNGASRHNENHTPQSSEQHTPHSKLPRFLLKGRK